MSKKILCSIIIIIAIMNIFIINKVFAENNNIVQMELNCEALDSDNEVVVIVTAAPYNGSIAGVSFTLNYDKDLFDYIKDETGILWDTTKIENTYTAVTKNLEGTNETGEVVRITLKAKNSIKEEVKTNIYLTSIEIANEDATTVKQEDETAKKEIAIKAGDNGSGNSNGNNEFTSISDNKIEQKKDQNFIVPIVIIVAVVVGTTAFVLLKK